MGVSARRLDQMRAEYPDAPPPIADGRYDIELWREFFRKHGFGKLDETMPDPEGETESANVSRHSSLSDIKKATAFQDFRLKEIKADLESQKAIRVDDLEQHLGGLLAAVQNGMDAFPDRAAPMVQGFSDVPEIAKILHGEMQSTLGQLQLADFERAIEETPEHLKAEVLAALKRIGNFYLERTELVDR